MRTNLVVWIIVALVTIGSGFNCDCKDPVEPEPTGSLLVSTYPSKAVIRLDNQSTGQKTPWSFLEVTVGTHVLELHLDGYKTWSGNVEVTENETAVIEVVLVKEGAKTGTLSVSSTPSQASVSLNDQPAGKTPTEIELEVGKYTLKLSLEGYQDWTGQIEIKEEKELLVQAGLLPVGTKTGQIIAGSTPSGASIFLDNSPTGTVTPDTLEVSEGEHTVKLTLENYQDFSQTVNVKAGSQVIISASLIPVGAETGSISIQSTPPGADIYLDGLATGKKTPATLKDIAEGEHTVKLTLTGYEDFEQSVTVTAGQTANVSATLTMLPQKGAIYVSSTPQGARIYLNGTDSGEITPATIGNLNPGTYTLKLVLEGYEEYQEEVEVSEGQTTTVEAILVGIPTTFVGNEAGLFWSTDEEHWQKTIGITDVRVLALANDNQTMYVVGWNGDFLRSQDAGKTWTQLGTKKDVVSLAIDPTNPSILYRGIWGGPYGGTAEKSTNGGESWSQVLSGQGPDAFWDFAINPTNPSVVFAAGMGAEQKLFKTENGGETWSTVLNKGIECLAIDPINPQTVYAAGSDVWKTTDGGNNWSKISNQDAFSLIISPQNTQVLYAGDPNGAYKSQDGGAGWIEILAGKVNRVYLDPSDSQIIYAISEEDGFKSSDAGISWQSIKGNIPAGSGDWMGIVKISP